MSKSFKDDFRNKEQRGNSRRPRQNQEPDMIEFTEYAPNFHVIIDTGTRKMQKAMGRRVGR
jgi:hypothetical protein